MEKLNVIKYNQRDLDWHNLTLGTGSLDIGSVGCLLTCMAMLCTYYGHKETPDTLNKKLIDIAGYSNGNLYTWYSGVPKIYLDITCTGLFPVPDPLTAGQEAIIDAELSAGRPVVCEVDFNPYTAAVDMHWVLIIGKNDEGIYIINDPWDGTEKLITQYGKQRITIQYFVLHTGTPMVDDALKVCLEKHTELVDKCNDKDKKIAELVVKITDLEKQVGEKDQEIVKQTYKVGQWDTTCKAYGIENFEQLDAKIRATQNSSLNNYVLKTDADETMKNAKRQADLVCKLKIDKAVKDALVKNKINIFTKISNLFRKA